VTQPILIMGPTLEGGLEALPGYQLTPLITSERDLARLGGIAGLLEVHLKIDTGMNRVGVDPNRVAAILTEAPRNVRVAGLASHFACADTDDPLDLGAATYVQLERFVRAAHLARPLLTAEPVWHIANSAGLLRFPEARLLRLAAELGGRAAVRPGLALYGNGYSEAGLAQAMRFVARIAQIRTVPAGASVSYGALWTAQRDSRVAVLPVGYADGYPRRLTGRAEVLVRGQRCPVVGAVCMDMTLVDVTSIADAASGDETVLLGGQGEDSISTREFAQWSGLSEYEVTCGISKRVPRVYT
jgi:alanine racemase